MQPAERQREITRAEFEPHVAEYLQQVSDSGIELVITDSGLPVARVLPCKRNGAKEALQALRGTVLRYDDPTEPVAVEEWEALH